MAQKSGAIVTMRGAEMSCRVGKGASSNTYFPGMAGEVVILFVVVVVIVVLVAVAIAVLVMLLLGVFVVVVVVVVVVQDCFEFVGRWL